MVLLSFISSFFAPCGSKAPAGVFTAAHFLTSSLVFSVIAVALYFTVRKPQYVIRRIIRGITAVIWVLEAGKTFLCFRNGNCSINETVPLYFCSIVLYAGLLSSFCRGRARRMGDVFLSCGAVTGGAVFLLLPLSSFTVYPLLHFITLQSVVLHGGMVYMGLRLVLSGAVVLRHRDIFYYAPPVLGVSVCALAVNLIWGSNLMFISRNYPNTPIELLYRCFPPPFFTVITVAGQLTLPFYMGLFLNRLLLRVKKPCKIEEKGY